MNFFEEPTWCEPQEALSDCSSLVYTGPTPFIMTGIFVRLLQYHFSDPDNIMHPALKGYTWTNSSGGCISSGGNGGGVQCPPGSSGSSGSCSSDPCQTAPEFIEGSKIYIAPEYKRDDQTVQQRPALLVKREPSTTGKISFRNAVAASKVRDKGVWTGLKHNIYLDGKHSIICLGKTGAEADLLGEEVFYRMLHYMPIIRDDFRLGQFWVEGISEVQERGEESSKVFYTIVRLSWAITYRWKVVPETPILKRFVLTYDENAKAKEN
jgi:hypothetical protein